MPSVWFYRGFATGLLALVAFSAAGCSSFKKRWREAASPSSSASGLAGRWEGEWKSSANGHSGRLRCVVTETGEGHYQAAYQAKYWSLLTFHYGVPLITQQTEPPFHFSGEANLGWWAGGRYKYEGVADTNTFVSSYSSKADHGEFRMTRK